MILRKLSRTVSGVALGASLIALVALQRWPISASDETSSANGVPAAAEVQTDGPADSESAGLAEQRFLIASGNLPLESLIRDIAARTGLKFEMRDVPPGTIAHKGDQLYTNAEALDLIRGFLLEKNFLLAQRDESLVVVDLGKVKDIDRTLVPVVRASDLRKRGKHELLIMPMPPMPHPTNSKAFVEYTNALEKLLGRHGSNRGIAESGELLIQDTAENLRKIHKALTEIQAKSATVVSRTAGDESPKNNTGEPQEKEAVESEPASPARGFGAGGTMGRADGGFGGRMMGGDPFAFGRSNPRYTAGKDVAAAWSESGDTIWGYSLLKGKWSKVKITPPKKGIAPTVGLSVIAVVTDDRVYAFSNQAARWDVLKSKGIPQVWQDRVIVEEDGQYHIFSDATGRWASQSEAVEETETEATDRTVRFDSKPAAVRVPTKRPPMADQRMKDRKKEPIGSPGQSTSGALGAAVGVAGGGFGGGGYEGGGFGGSARGIGGSSGDRITVTGSWNILPPSAIPSKHYIETQEAIVAWSEAKDTLWGYSDSLRKWNKLRIARPNEPLNPVGGFSVIAVRADDRTYAYSAKTGTWDELRTTAQPIIQAHRIVVEDKGKAYIFTAADGRWMSPNDSLLADNVDAVQDMGLMPAGRLSGRAFGGMDRMNAAPISNSQGDAELLLQGFSAQGVVDDLGKAYDQTDREIKQAAAEYRKTLERHAPDDTAIAQLKARIETLVEKAFTLRQQAQATEAEIHRHRLKQIDSRLAERERLKEKITQRRVQDLLNPALNWEAPATDTTSRR